ncbi:MAG: hypothetical protein OER22_05300 [Gammaproteobacteria bacterium]|nr:hypothetical protein [Gammaproteobacteria bacterium]
MSTANAKGDSAVPDPLFASNEPLDVRIVAPFDSIALDRPTQEYVSGQLQYRTTDGKLVDLDVGIRARGRYRRRPDVCAFPPLRLNFKKSQVKKTLFAGQDKLKLVTHCTTGSYIHEQSILAEFLAYRFFNLLTDASYRVRLLRIKYANPNEEIGIDGYGIFIEHKDSLAKRIGLPPLSVEKIPVSSLDPEYLNLTSVFHYLIGNTDFSPIAGAPGGECCHNHTLFGGDGTPYISVPYDFDMSGFVSAPYAAPNPKLRLDSVQDRLYRGRCVNNERLPTTFEKIVARRDDFEALIRDQAGLSRKMRSGMLRYVDEFYRTISRPKSVERHFIKKCK